MINSPRSFEERTREEDKRIDEYVKADKNKVEEKDNKDQGKDRK